jgi:hypothetical protein
MSLNPLWELRHIERDGHTMGENAQQSRGAREPDDHVPSRFVEVRAAGWRRKRR